MDIEWNKTEIHPLCFSFLARFYVEMNEEKKEDNIHCKIAAG